MPGGGGAGRVRTASPGTRMARACTWHTVMRRSLFGDLGKEHPLVHSRCKGPGARGGSVCFQSRRLVWLGPWPAQASLVGGGGRGHGYGVRGGLMSRAGSGPLPPGGDSVGGAPPGACPEGGLGLLGGEWIQEARAGTGRPYEEDQENPDPSPRPPGLNLGPPHPHPLSPPICSCSPRTPNSDSGSETVAEHGVQRTQAAAMTNTRAAETEHRACRELLSLRRERMFCSRCGGNRYTQLGC